MYDIIRREVYTRKIRVDGDTHKSISFLIMEINKWQTFGFCFISVIAEKI